MNLGTLYYEAVRSLFETEHSFFSPFVIESSHHCASRSSFDSRYFFPQGSWLIFKSEKMILIMIITKELYSEVRPMALYNIVNPKRCRGGVIHPTVRRLSAISQGMIQMFSNFLTFSKMMLGSG